MDVFEERCYEESASEAEFSDDSEDDSTFDVEEETLLTFSDLSIDRKTKSRTVKGKDDEGDKCSAIGLAELEFDEKGQKSYETIHKIVEAGQVTRLKVHECKIYLRRHGLRLSGTKQTLIQRIKEHIDIAKSGGEKNYPASSFVVNCKGDACVGDVVMFEQNVYEMYNIASRSANGPCGTRTVAGRILKESYGAAKQQHTFTIEVLWCKGEKTLPPLHPLLIKGRNLYRLKTMRQKWDDEGERQKTLSEKHDRGACARLNRKARREMRKVHKQTRAARNEHQNREQKEQTVPDPARRQNQGPKTHNYSRTCMPMHQKGLLQKPYGTSQAQGNPERQPLISMNCAFPRDQHTGPQHIISNFNSASRGGFHHPQQSHFPSMNAATNPRVQHLGACRHYIKGRCYYGDRCKFSHDSAGNNM